MAIRGRPREPRPTWRDFLDADELAELAREEVCIHRKAGDLEKHRAVRRKLQQRASRRMTAKGNTWVSPKPRKK